MVRDGSLHWPSLRFFLLQLHYDLFEIHLRWDEFSDFANLTTVEKMVLVLEDRRFFSHFGIDFPSLGRELLKAVSSDKFGGASTIDMQWVRTCTGYRQRTLRRKVYEGFLAAIIQQRYSKIQILRSYLSCAYFGTRIKGIEEASMSVFGIHSPELNVEQAAEIAAMLVYPRPSNITNRWLLKLMRRKNYAMLIYPRYKKRFEKLKIRKI